jgi:hypothetical protein
MPRKQFDAFTRLDASDVNSFLMDQSVMSFADTAARGSAIPSPVEGMAAYLNDSNILSLYDGSAWKNSLATTGGVLQVVSTIKTDTFASSVTSFTDVTGLSVSITPTSVNSRILVLASVSVGFGSEGANQVTLADGSNNNLVAPTSPGSRTPGFSGVFANNSSWLLAQNFTLLHSPNTTSAFTYKIRSRSQNGINQFINQTGSTDDSSSFVRGVSTITVMEIAG